MAKTRIRITTPYPTVEYVAKTFRIPPGRVKKIVSMVDEIVEQLEREKKAARTPRRKPRRGQHPKP